MVPFFGIMHVDDDDDDRAAKRSLYVYNSNNNIIIMSSKILNEEGSRIWYNFRCSSRVFWASLFFPPSIKKKLSSSPMLKHGGFDPKPSDLIGYNYGVSGLQGGLQSPADDDESLVSSRVVRARSEPASPAGYSRLLLLSGRGKRKTVFLKNRIDIFDVLTWRPATDGVYVH